MNKGSNIGDWRLFQFFLLIGLSIGLLYPLLSFKGITEVSCPFNHLTSEPCPSCGLSRAWNLLYTGQFEQALEANPNAYRLLMLLILQIIWRGYLIVKAVSGKPIIIWDFIITLSSVTLLAGPYLKDLLRFVISYYS
nr:DUF2752 domain-containing protein [uncultured Carboxylicivirga sp.]